MSPTLAYILGIIVLIAGLAISVALHELGHMVPAKRFGVKVPEYFIGFGPRIWSIRRGETEYGAEAREEALAELGPDEQDRAFYRLSVPRKLLVMAGGILTNLVLGIVCLALALGAVGQYTATSTLSSVEPCVPAAVGAPGSQCASDSSDSASSVSPAVAAGMRAGDEIVSWNGVPTPAWADIQAAIRSGGTEPADVVVRRDGTETTLSVTPVEVERTVTAADGSASTELRPYVGIEPRARTVRVAPSRVPGEVATAVGQTLKAIITLPVGLYHSVAAGLGLEERRADGLVSLVLSLIHI